MHRFFESIIHPALAILHPRVIVEVGIDEGFHTEKLLRYCKEAGAVLHGIDPEPQCDIPRQQAVYGERFVFHRDLSLNALYRIDAYDVVLIDGDHNWYTVYHELLLIEKHAKEHGNFPLVFLHDTGWPYGRRDLYYDPDNIPAAYRQPYEKKGIVPGTGTLADEQGWNPERSNAIYEHNVRNGVLTAVEDFMTQSTEKLHLTTIPGFHGLGILASATLLSRNSNFQEFLASLRLSPPITSHIDALENVHFEHIEHIVSDRRRRQKQCETEQELERAQGQRDALRGELERAQGQRDALRGELEHMTQGQRDALRGELERAQGQRDALRGELEHMTQTRSWRWTTPLRHVERALYTSPYHLLSAAKDVWSDLGAPCPRSARFIRHTILGRLLPVRTHATPSSPPSSPSDNQHPPLPQPSAISIAAIVVCTPTHRAVAPTIDSLIAQTQKPAEILVVDDSGSSDVHSAALAYAGRGVEYLHGSWRNRSAARNAGLACTESSLLVFLTSGDIPPPEYIRTCATALSTDSATAIAYADGSPYPFDEARLERENIITDVAMVRRGALQMIGGWPEGLHSDAAWITWRRIVANGWTVVKVSGAMPSYTSQRVMVSSSNHDTRLDSTLCLSLSGRAWMWPLTREFLECQTYPHDRTHLVIVDTSQEQAFGEAVQAWLARCDYGQHTYIPLAAGLKGLADLPRRVVKREVAEACASVYNAFTPYCTTPWVFFLEDDVIPPLDAFPTLLRHFGDDVASVSALCMQRGSSHPIAWEWDEDGMPSKINSPLAGVTAVGGNGFCCVVFRGAFLRNTQLCSGPGDLCHDHNFYKNVVCERGLKAMLDWSCVCRHYVGSHEWV